MSADLSESLSQIDELFKKYGAVVELKTEKYLENGSTHLAVQIKKAKDIGALGSEGQMVVIDVSAHPESLFASLEGRQNTAILLSLERWSGTKLL